MSSTAALILGGLAAAGGVASSAIGASAAGSAADTQAQSAQNALDYTKQAEAPYLNLGNTSISKLMDALNNGTFGPGSQPAFSLPTEAEAEATPGFAFTRDQGLLGIDRAAAAAGGAFTGGTLKQAAGYAGGLADNTYQNTVSNALSAYGANLSNNAQEYQQLITPLTIGANAASGTSTNVANLLTQIGNAQASGTVGSANSIINGINGATSGVGQSLLLSKLLGGGSGGGGTLPNPVPGNFNMNPAYNANLLTGGTPPG